MQKKSDTDPVKNHPKRWLRLLPKLTADSNKYTRGHTVIVGGFPLTGAARLSAYAAARVGSGLTTLLVPAIAFPVYAGALTSVMVKPFADMNTFGTLINDDRINCFLIGPGAGVSEDTKSQTLSLLKTGKPVLLDADAINVFQGDITTLKEHIRQTCVLTPHEGEFQRLFKLSEDRVASVQRAAKDCGAIVLLKGSKTIIAAPDGQTIINDNAPPALATGGSGDVLSGMIAGLIAQGMPALHAAAAATWMHAEAAKLFGIGLIAEDLIEMLPTVLASLDAG